MFRLALCQIGGSPDKEANIAKADKFIREAAANGAEFFFAILSLILGIVGLIMPNAAAMTNDFILLYLAAGWFIVHGILSIVTAIQSKRNGDDTGSMVLCIVLGVLELIIGIYSFAHPAMMAVALGILIGIYFIETGINAIVIGREVDD